MEGEGQIADSVATIFFRAAGRFAEGEVQRYMATVEGKLANLHRFEGQNIFSSIIKRHRSITIYYEGTIKLHSRL